MGDEDDRLHTVVSGPWPDPADPEAVDEVRFLEWLLSSGALEPRRTPITYELHIDIYLPPE